MYVCLCMSVYVCMVMYVCMMYVCLCLRTENRSRKTHVFEYRDCGVEWGGVGGHVNVPCTSYMIYCHAAEISGIVYYVTCCYAADGVGWGGMLTFLVLRAWYIAMLLRSLGSFTTLHVLMGWGGVGWGVMLTFLVLRTWYIAMLLRSLGLFTTLHVSTLLRSLGSFTTLHVATLLRSLGSFTTLYVATLLRSLGSFTTLHVLCGIRWKSQFPATWVPKVTSWWCVLELGNGDAPQECWLPADNCACVAAMTLKSQKTRPKFFQDFQSSNQHGTVVESPFLFKNVRFMGTVSGPAGCLCMYVYVCMMKYVWWCMYVYLCLCMYVCM